MRHLLVTVLLLACSNNPGSGPGADSDTATNDDSDTDTDSNTDLDTNTSSDPCEDIICDDPPPPYCKDGFQLYPSDAGAFCINGECNYTYQAWPCFTGECAGDICSGACEEIVCEQSIDDRCGWFDDGLEFLSIYADEGICVDIGYVPGGWCVYESEKVYCPNGCTEVDSDDDYCAE